MAFLYICVNNKWKDTSPTNAPVPIPDCLCTYTKLTLRRQRCFFPIFQTSTMGLKMLVLTENLEPLLWKTLDLLLTRELRLKFFCYVAFEKIILIMRNVFKTSIKLIGTLE